MKESRPVLFFNRYTRQLEKEKILGERMLRWVYDTGCGQIALHLLIKRGIFSRLMGRWQETRRSARRIPSFIRDYEINTDEMLLAPESFRTFNDFFIRELKPEARPICSAPLLALPADGRHRGWQDASSIRAVYVKGQSFNLSALLGHDAKLVERFEHGALLLSRLCPVDYHRFHFPASGVPEAARRLSGPLASVAPFCLRRRLDWLWRNKRELTLLHTQDIGDVAIIAVGATGVGSIHQTYIPECFAPMGSEQGYFCFGGSTVICLFEPGRVRMDDDLLEQTERGYELYAHFGDHFASSLCKSSIVNSNRIF